MVDKADRTGFLGMAKLGLVHTLYEADTADRYHYERSAVGKLGRALLTPIEWPLHHLLREITHPLTIVSLTMAGVAGVTVGFYPREFRNAVSLIIPAASNVKPWMLKFSLYGALQLTILSLGLRAYGRFSNPTLVTAWRTGTIDGQYIGHARRQ